ncbi:MFS transporter [Candidatus Bipolaricaulota bacterium]|nr:MFS transporter [Candidatus Bipolaricaulota bacterium]
MSATKQYLHRVLSFSPNARWYLLYSVLSGFAMGILQLLFNLYVLSLGFNAGTLGLLVALPPVVVTLSAIPMGMLGHRIGFRTALLVGVVLMAISMVGISLSSVFVGLAVFAALRGLSQTMLQVSSAPYMAENSGVAERTHLFSVQFSARLFANFFGLLLAGVLPGLFARAMHIGAEAPGAYRGALIVAAVLYSLAMLPLWRTKPDPSSHAQTEPMRLREMFHPPGLLLRLFLPQVVIGLGAGALVPFFNVFFKMKFGVPDSTLGVLFAVQSVFMGVATLIGPALAERWGKTRTVVGMQVVSVPFIGLIGYVPLLSISATGFLFRAALMNAANPLYTAFIMEKVSDKQRGAASAMMQMSWQGTRAISSLASGYLQESSGFALLFPITIVMYSLASLLIYTFFIKNVQRDA